MNKVFILLILLFFCAFSQTGIIKTFSYTDTIADTNLVAFGSADINKYEDLFIVIKADDTSETGFANDSIKIRIMYQIGDYSFNSSSKKDTIWFNELIKIDTFDIADILPLTSTRNQQGKAPSVNTSTDFTITDYAPDSVNVSGFSSLVANIIPVVKTRFIKIYGKSLAGHKKGSPVIFSIELHGNKK